MNHRLESLAAKFPNPRMLIHSPRTWALIVIMSATMLQVPQLAALDFEGHGGEVRGTFDTTLTYGVAVRASNRDKDLIGRQNGGTANSVNGDNGNLNYDSGDLVSNNIKATHELQAKYQNYTFFARGLYFYDFEIMHGDTERTPLSRSAERYLGKDARLLDAYLSGNYEVDDSLLNVRLGNQVLSWGESTFIANGINNINHIDVSRFRTAGAELRDGLMPIPMVNATYSFDENISTEAFYLFQWNNTEIEPEGTFFATNDFASPGGNTVLLGFGAPGIQDNPPLFGLNPPVGFSVPRRTDRDADDQGQFGFALRYFAPELNDTEFALYYTKLHSRLPLINGRTGTLIGAGAGDYASSASYQRVFPEDIQTVGAGFNTEVPGTGYAIQGELSYRMDQPLQADDVELLFAALSPLNPQVFGQSQLGAYGFGEEIVGYIERDVWQGQVSVSKVLGPNLGADQWVLVGEIGGTYIDDMPDKDELRLEAGGTFTSGNPFFTAAGIQPETEPSSAFPDDFSWGTRLRARADFNNAIGAVNLKPQLAWSWDQGTTPAPIANFVDDRQSVTASLGADYLNAYQFELAYTNFYNGGRYNLLKDRDFFSFTASYAF